MLPFVRVRSGRYCPATAVFVGRTDASACHLEHRGGLTGKDVAAVDVVARADEALYQAKRAGRDTFVVSHW
jgi:GGDEF domain-containing protein